MEFPAKTTRHSIIDGFFHRDLGQAAFCKTIKLCVYPLTEERLNAMKDNGKTHVHLMTETVIRESIKHYPYTDQSEYILSIEDALKLLKEETDA